MSEGKMIEIYNKGLSEVMSVLTALTNEIESLNSQVETLEYTQFDRHIGKYV